MIKSCKNCGRFLSKKNKHKCGFNNPKITISKEDRKRAMITLKEKYHNKGIFFGFKGGKKHLNWKGNKVGYMGVHNYIRKIKDKIDYCEYCNKKVKLEIANISGKYKRNVKDFKWLCRGCHQKLDRTQQEFKYEKIKSIKIDGCDEDFYDIETETENFIANGIVTHNCRPSKRSIASGFYMPSILKETIEIVVSIDTSGSIGQEELSEFLSEITGIAKSFNNLKMKIITHDAEIQDIYDITSSEISKISKLKIKGGGGTEFNGIVKSINKQFPNTKYLVWFTDGYGNNIEERTNYPILWVLNKNGSDEIAKRRNKDNIIWLKE